MYGTVMSIATTPTEADGAYGSEPTWAVDIVVTTVDHNLKPGMTADVTVLLQQVPDTLIVPASSIWEEMGSDGQLRHYVLVLTSSSTGATRKAEVAVSAVNDTEAAVWGELTEGDLVVTNPTFASDLPESSESSESSE
jgi:HlyD family secretion protein